MDYEDDDGCDGTCGARGCDPRVCLDCGRFDLFCECDREEPVPPPADDPAELYRELGGEGG